jgi:spore coat polysaccharide biosynthesis protein SpsF
MACPSIVGIIPARVDSTRFPGKTLRKVKGIPLIGYVMARAKRIPNLEALILATTERSIDDPLCEYALSKDVALYRGDLYDVALRVLRCAEKFGSDYFVRLNADSPFLDPALIAQGMVYCQDGRTELVTNLIDRTFPYGIAVEIIETDAFERAYERMRTAKEREHVTYYLYTHQEEFQIQTLTSPCPELSRARLVVDTKADFEMFTRVLGQLGETVSTAGYRQVAETYLAQRGIS